MDSVKNKGSFVTNNQFLLLLNTMIRKNELVFFCYYVYIILRRAGEQQIRKVLSHGIDVNFVWAARNAQDRKICSWFNIVQHPRRPHRRLQ